jgi:hypothetical protein
MRRMHIVAPNSGFKPIRQPAEFAPAAPADIVTSLRRTSQVPLHGQFRGRLPRLRSQRQRHGEPVLLENRILDHELRDLGCQAARSYSLIWPLAVYPPQHRELQSRMILSTV